MNYPGSLHTHSEYSNLRLRDSLNKLEDLIDYSIELGHEVLAITEHDALCGHIRAEKYYNKIKEKNPNFKLIHGNEIYLVRNGLTSENFDRESDRYFHFILLAKDRVGHEQLERISTMAWNRSYVARRMRRVPTYYNDLISIIGEDKGHIIGSTACLGGYLPNMLLKYKDNPTEDNFDKILHWLTGMDNIFGHGNFFLEMQPSKNKEQIYVNEMILKLSEQLDIPYIITTDAHYLRKSDMSIHKAFLNAQNGDRETESFYATTYQMGTEEIESYMTLTREQLDKAYSNILKIKDMCEDYSLRQNLHIPYLPKDITEPDYNLYLAYKNQIPMLEKFYTSVYDSDRHLVRALINSIERDKQYQNKETYVDLNECLEYTWQSSEVNKSRWSAYFLNLADYIDIIWQSGSLVGCGRGSGVGFLLLNMLNITQINPLREQTATFKWRFLNPSRVSPLDVDIDIETSKRAQVIAALKQAYGEDRVSNVATFKTEKAKSAIQTAARGLGIDNDISAYLSSLVAAERGIQRTLSQTFYGDEENDIPANKTFVKEMTENYPELWELARRIEGLIVGVGQHAGGVIFTDKPFYKNTALMRAPKGDIITQYDLHDAEDAGLIKIDLLSVNALDRIHLCLDLLIKQEYVSPEPTLRETYEKVIGIYNLERNDIKMWEKAWNHEVVSLFQMEQPSGIQGIALTRPKSVDDLAVLNSVIRLMAQEKGGEQPLNKYARFKTNPNLWYQEMSEYGLNKEEQKVLEPIVGISYGICESQEKFMQLVQLPECGGFDLTFADKLRKSIAKKNPAEYDKLTKIFFEETAKKGCSARLCNYVWNVLIATSRGYGFNASHTLAYSLIALQELNLAYRYPTIFWNCACLIADSSGEEGEDYEETDELNMDDGENSVTESNEETEDMDADDDDSATEEDDEEDVSASSTGKKTTKKAKPTNYDKIAKALNKMIQEGVTIVPPNINTSDFTFSPDPSTNSIIYGLKGIARINKDIIQNIFGGRPYSGLHDFLSKVKVTKPQMTNLIKSGAFDIFGDRVEIMKDYILSISDQKKRITLQNMAMLIEKKLLPESLSHEISVFNFNKYLKKHKTGANYELDEIASVFYDKHYDIDLTFFENEVRYVKQTDWDKIYKKEMDKARDYLKANSAELLVKLNNQLYQETYDKYASGSLSKWEMDSICFYYHPHELAAVHRDIYEFANFFKMPEDPIIDRTFEKGGKKIPIFKTFRFAGTVLAKDKGKGIVTILTTDGVVSVRIFKNQFAEFDKQISERGLDGKKHVVEKSWFSRGNKIMVNGFRRGNDLVLKKYKNTPYPVLSLITEINDDGTLEYKSEREVE